MKIKDLDKTKTYYLGDLSRKESDAFFSWLSENDERWIDNDVELAHRCFVSTTGYCFIYYHNNHSTWCVTDREDDYVNAKELFYTEEEILNASKEYFKDKPLELIEVEEEKKMKGFITL